MEIHPKINTKTIAIAVLILALIVGGIWYWWARKAAPGSAGLGERIFEKVQNPLKDELPQTNPFKAESNPFQKAETNPFQNTYKNPFQ